MSVHSAGDTILGRYRLEHEIGEGAFGTTWASRDMQSGDAVAVKELDLSKVNDWKVVELFEREAHTLEQLDHPRIPDYIDFVPVKDDETGYLVQTLAPGETLEAVLRRKERFDNQEIEGIAEKALEILVYLESLNPPVVHRDIKPANLLIDDDANVYLVDFGAVQDAAKRTTEGGSTVAGTFGYMAPEQLHGSASPRSDLYALGMTLIHLATGVHPSELPRKGLDIEFQRHVDLPDEMVKFIEKLVAPNPDERWDSAVDALAFLRHEVPFSPNLKELPAGGSSIAEKVRAREQAARRAELEADQARMQAIEERKRKVAARRDRATVAMNHDEVHMEFRPIRWPMALGAGGISLFLFFNPGFAIAGGFPFLGPLWPFFSDFWLGRWAVWGAFMFLACVAFVFWKTPPRNIRLSREGFFTAYNRNEDNPDEAGRFSNFQVTVYGQEPGFPGETVKITLTDSDDQVVFEESFGDLSKADVDLLATLPDDWIEPGKKVALDFESGDSTVASRDVVSVEEESHS